MRFNRLATVQHVYSVLQTQMVERPVVSTDALSQVMTEAGPWHARSLQMGQDHMSALKQDFLAEYANPDTDSVVHHPRARLIVIQKVQASL